MRKREEHAFCGVERGREIKTWFYKHKKEKNKTNSCRNNTKRNQVKK